MKIYYLGTCSGTEPMQGLHHCSLVFEVGGAYYWFDAGESCAHTAHTSGMDVTKARCVFISHSHMDHIAGLPALLACMHKIVHRYKTPMKYDNTLKVYTPDLAVFDAVKTVACGNIINDKYSYKLLEFEVSEGIVYEDENIRVSALHNRHLGENGRSYSYLIEAEGKRAVFSGDLLKPCELDPFTDAGCDLLIMETGHHSVADVCEYASSRGVKALRFNHHGREIIGDREGAEQYVTEYGARHGIDIKLCYDGMVEEFNC